MLVVVEVVVVVVVFGATVLELVDTLLVLTVGSLSPVSEAWDTVAEDGDADTAAAVEAAGVTDVALLSWWGASVVLVEVVVLSTVACGVDGLASTAFRATCATDAGASEVPAVSSVVVFSSASFFSSSRPAAFSELPSSWSLSSPSVLFSFFLVALVSSITASVTADSWRVTILPVLLLLLLALA